MNGAPDARIGPTAANISGHSFCNVLIGRRSVFRQETRRAHDLPRLAVAALWNVNFNPSLLQRMRKVGRNSFNGRNFLPFRARNGSYARAHRLPVDVDGASAAERHPAAKLRPGKV